MQEAPQQVPRRGLTHRSQYEGAQCDQQAPPERTGLFRLLQQLWPLSCWLKGSPCWLITLSCRGRV